MTTYRVIDQSGKGIHFIRFKEAKAFALEVSRLTGKGVEIKREPNPFEVQRIMLSI